MCRRGRESRDLPGDFTRGRDARQHRGHPRAVTMIPGLAEILETVRSWAGQHRLILAWLSVGSIVSFAGTLVAIPIMVARMPRDYFLYDKSELRSYRKSHPAWSLVTVVLKNALGVVFIACGVLMLFLPGQGVLTMLIGFTLLSFPGKRDIELSLARRPAVLGAMNWIRRRAGKDPLVLPGPRASGSARRRL